MVAGADGGQVAAPPTRHKETPGAAKASGVSWSSVGLCYKPGEVLIRGSTPLWLNTERCLPAAAAAATAAATTATAGLTLLRLANLDVAAVKHRTVKGINDRLGFLGGAHFNETEAPRLAGFTVGDDVHILNGTTVFGEHFAEGLVCRVPGEVADEESSTHLVVSFGGQRARAYHGWGSEHGTSVLLDSEK